MEHDVCCGMVGGEEKLIAKIKEDLEQLVAHSGEVHYKKGQVLFYEGHYPYGFFIVRKGDVSLFRTTLWGQHEDLTPTGDSIFGLFHLVTNTPHCATAQAQSHVVVSFIPKSMVLDFLDRAKK